MEKENAAKLEGMLVASRLLLESFSDFIRENVPTDKRRTMMIKLGRAMSELVDVSRMIYDEHPDLDPHLANRSPIVGRDLSP